MPERIIIVDDDQEVREIVTFVLKQYGFEVVAASSGQQLYHLLNDEMGIPPNLIILDVMMPGEDGYRLCRNLREGPLTKGIPIIIITGHTEDIYKRISEDLGAVQHITKPFHPLDLAEKVDLLLRP
jgi:DNA-binding response OmpR family regulator